MTPVRASDGIACMARSSQRYRKVPLGALVGECPSPLYRHRSRPPTLRPWPRTSRDDVARPVSSVGLVGGQRRGDRLAALVVETALRDVFAEAHPVHAATKAQCDHDSDNSVSESVHRSTPPGEHD